MPHDAAVLVVGAGPVGLAAAIELNRRGLPVRIIDRDPEPTSESRAVAVNARTLELMEPSGVTDRLIAAGVKLRGVRILSSGRVRAVLDATRIPHRYNFMLALPQNETERVLAQALAERGVEVEQGTELQSLQPEENGPVAALATPQGTEETRFAWVVGADGAHSAVRKQLAIGFPGGKYPFEWTLADVDLAGDVEVDRGEIHLDPGQPILFRVPIGPGRHRVIANGPDVLGRVPAAWKVTDVRWQSSFSVSHRQADRLGAGRVWLIGDAAHIHSPAGGRGMNLGIEDAATLAERIAAGALGGWADQRRARAATVIRESDAMQRMATTDGHLARTVVPRLVGAALAISPLHKRFVRNIAGV